MWGFKDIYRVFIAPNGHSSPSVKSSCPPNVLFGFITPLFLGVDVSPEGEVVVIYSLGMKVEVKSLLAHFGLYVAHIFDRVVWEAFTFENNLKMDCYQYYPIKNCTVEIDNSSIDSDKSVDREFAKCGLTDDMLVIADEVELDLPHQLTLHLCLDINGILEDENGDSATFKSNVSDTTLATSKTAPSNPIQYLVPSPKLPTIPSVSGNNETPTVIMKDPNKKIDASKTLSTPTKNLLRKTLQTLDWKNPVKIRDFFDTASFMMNNIAMKASKGRHHCRHTHLVSAKKVERMEEKGKRKMVEQHKYNNNKNNNNHIFNNNHNNHHNNNNLQKLFTNQI